MVEKEKKGKKDVRGLDTTINTQMKILKVEREKSKMQRKLVMISTLLMLVVMFGAVYYLIQQKEELDKSFNTYEYVHLYEDVIKPYVPFTKK